MKSSNGIKLLITLLTLDSWSKSFEGSQPFVLPFWTSIRSGEKILINKKKVLDPLGKVNFPVIQLFSQLSYLHLLVL